MHYAGARIKAEASGIHYLTSAPPWIDESRLRVGNCLRHPQRIEGSDRPEAAIAHLVGERLLCSHKLTLTWAPTLVQNARSRNP